MLAAGILHLANLNRHASLRLNRRTCKATFTAKQTTTIDGGTGRFAGATGTFAGTTTGSGVARRKPDGSCDQLHPPIVEIDIIATAGTLTF